MKRLLLLSIFLGLLLNANAQVKTNFDLKDTICIKTYNTVFNSSVNTSNQIWSVCEGSTAVDLVTRKSIDGQDSLLYAAKAEDSNGKFLFVIQHLFGGASRLVRYEFGNSYLNPTKQTSLNVTGELPPLASGLFIYQQANNWYGVLGGQLSSGKFQLLRLNFGNTLLNVPSTQYFNPKTSLPELHSIDCAFEKNELIGFATNTSSNSITRFSYGTTASDSPVELPIGVVGSFNRPTNLKLLQDQSLGWILFVANTGDTSVTILKFGNSLKNFPVANTVRLPAIKGQLNALNVVKICGAYYLQAITNEGQVAGSGEGKVYSCSLSKDLDNVLQTDLKQVLPDSKKATAAVYVKEGSKMLEFVLDKQSKTSLLDYYFCSKYVYTPTKEYNAPTLEPFEKVGTVSVSLMTDIGLPTQNSVCKTTYIEENFPKPVLMGNRDYCDGEEVELYWSDTTRSVNWYLKNNFISSEQVLRIQNATSKASGVYHAQITAQKGDCGSYEDSIKISVTKRVDAVKDTSFCIGRNFIGSKGQLHVGLVAKDTFGFPPCDSVITYNIKRFQMLKIGDLADSIDLEYGDVFLAKYDLNYPGELIAKVQLIHDGDTSLVKVYDDLVLNPLKGTQYKIIAQARDGCTAADSFYVKIFIKRSFYVPNIFKPENADGPLNARFMVFTYAKAVQLVKKFTVFNKTGAIVYQVRDFQGNDIAKGWDGSFKGEPLGTDQFIWEVEVLYYDGVSEVRHGTVLLYRN